MISADANFQAAESLQTLRPYFDAYFSPYLYPVDIEDGTFVNCVLESDGGFLPGIGTDGYGGFGDFEFGDYGFGFGQVLIGDLPVSTSGVRIIVIYASTSASWTSGIITNPAEILPASPTPGWDINNPGYSVVVQYRTSNNINQVPYLAWSTLTENVATSLYHYYQIRFIWTMIRAWSCDTLADANAFAYSAWAIDSLPSDHASYACEGTGELTWLDNLELVGEYQVNPNDVADMGEISEELGSEFGKLVAAEHTLTLINRDNKFTPGHGNFIFKETNWRRKGIRIAMGYERGGGTPINLYKGTVIDWGPRPVRVDPDLKVADKTVEVYSQSLAAKLLEKQIGVTDDDGNPNPWVCGEILHELVQLTDESPGGPEKTVLKLTDFDATIVDYTGNNTIADNTTETVKGMDSIKVVGASGGYALGLTNLGMANPKTLLSAWMMVKAIPTNIPDKDVTFMGWRLPDGSTPFCLTVGSNSRIYLYADIANEDENNKKDKETSWYLNQDLGVWKRISIALVADATNGMVKVWVNGDEVYSETGDFSSMVSLSQGFAGLLINSFDPNAGNWEIYFADIQVSPGWEPYAYRLYGAPYQSIGAVYQDGAIQQEVKKTQGPATLVTPQTLWDQFKPTYIPGTVMETDLITKNARKGLVIFNDYANPPSGTLMARSRKNDKVHPVDVIRAILEEADLTTAIDETSFAACKATIPNDSIGCWFEDMSLGDCLSAIGSRCLINILATLDLVRLLPYVGTAGTSATTLENWAGYDHSFKTQDIVSRVRVKWGWFERNKLLTYIARNEAAVSAVGLKDEELDFTWGQEVASDNEAMAKQKADWWLKRLCGDKEILEDFANPYSAARVECGDTVTVTSDDLFDTPKFLIVSKTMRLSPDYELSFQAEKYLGEM